MVLIGHASISETNGINGKPGDSTGKEVCVRTWYNKDWKHVFRCKNAKNARLMVDGMLAVCSNNNIGYGQSDRLTLYYALLEKSNNRGIASRYTVNDIKTISKKVNCDCSSLIAVLLNLCGYGVNPSMVTYNEYSAIMSTNDFIAYSGKYLYTPSLLKAGDILLSSGHTALVLANDSNPLEETETDSVKLDYAQDFTPEIAGTYVCNVTDYLCLRTGASVNHKIIIQMPPLHTVQNYGYHTGAWYYVSTSYKGQLYTGFCHSDYLKKVVGDKV